MEVHLHDICRRECAITVLNEDAPHPEIVDSVDQTSSGYHLLNSSRARNKRIFTADKLMPKTADISPYDRSSQKRKMSIVRCAGFSRSRADMTATRSVAPGE